MKKNIILLIIQIILCVVCFFNNWFKDNIISNLIFIIPFIVNIILIIVFLLVYFFSLSKFNQKTRFFKITSILLCFTTILLSFYDFRLIKTKFELSLYKEEREIIIKKIKNNEFSSYYKGNTKLPIYKYVSSDGEVYIYKNDNESQVIGFWISRGVMSGSVLLIYSPDKKTIYDYLKYVSEVKKLDDKWYYVITE